MGWWVTLCTSGSVVCVGVSATLLGLASLAVKGAAPEVHGVGALVVPQQAGDPGLGGAVAHLEYMFREV